MALATKANPDRILFQRIQMMMGLLGLQFILGMGLNTIGQPDKGVTNFLARLWQVLLVLHIVNAFILLASAAYIFIYSLKNRNRLKAITLIALLGIGLAIVFGILTVTHHKQELMSFFMALTFLIAISIYGRSLGQIHR